MSEHFLSNLREQIALLSRLDALAPLVQEAADSSPLTCIANDDDFQQVFARQGLA